MKTRIAILFLLFCTLSVNAQEINTPNFNSWYLGLNFGVYNFNSENNNNNLFISIEKKLNNHFSLSLGAGIGSSKPSNYNSISSIYYSESGDRILKSVNQEFNSAVSVPINLSIKYEPFSWNISPYISVGYGTEFIGGHSYVTTERTETYSPEGIQTGNFENTTTNNYRGVFGNGGILRVGVNYKLLPNLLLDANVLFNGINRPSLSVGAKLGF